MQMNINKGQVNIFVYMYIFICIGIAFTVNKFLHFENPLYYIISFIAGFFILPSIHYIGERIYNYYTYLPLCKNKKCKTNNYKLINKSDEGNEYICNCTEHYLLNGNDFFYLSEKKEKIKYMARLGEVFPWKPYKKIEKEKEKVDQIVEKNKKILNYLK